jgi:hypothetical protein
MNQCGKMETSYTPCALIKLANHVLRWGHDPQAFVVERSYDYRVPMKAAGTLK